MVKFGLVLPTVDLSFLELPAGDLGVGREEEGDLVGLGDDVLRLNLTCFGAEAGLSFDPSFLEDLGRELASFRR